MDGYGLFQLLNLHQLKASPRRLLRRKPAVVVGFSTQDHLLHSHYLSKSQYMIAEYCNNICYSHLYRNITKHNSSLFLLVGYGYEILTYHICLASIVF